MDNANGVTAIHKGWLDQDASVWFVGVCNESEIVNAFPELQVCTFTSVETVVKVSDQTGDKVIVYGSELSPAEVVAGVLSHGSGSRPRRMHIVLHQEASSGEFQELVVNGALFFLAHASLRLEDVKNVIGAAVLSNARMNLDPPLTDEEERRMEERCLEQLQDDDASRLALSLVQETSLLLNESAARCLFFDSSADMLYEHGTESGTNRLRASGGLIGYAVRTAQTVRIETAFTDPRYDNEVDGLGTEVEGSLLAHPLLSAEGEVLAVIVATRVSPQNAFTTQEQERLTALAKCALPYVQLMLRKLRSKQAHDQVANKLFLKEAIEHFESSSKEGEMLQWIPHWLSYSHLLVMLFFILGGAYLTFCRIPQVISGPAIARITERQVIVAPTDCVITQVLAGPGNHVSYGEPLVRVQRVTGAPSGAPSTYEITASAAGIVDVGLVHVGDAVREGDAVGQVVLARPTGEVVSIFPVSVESRIHVGMILKVTPQDTRPLSEVFVVVQVAPAQMSETEMKSFWGASAGPTQQVRRSVLLVRAAAYGADVRSDSRPASAYNVIQAQASIQITGPRLINMLLPGMRDRSDLHYSSSHNAETPDYVNTR